MRASVWASTALVGSTSTRISGSAASARASTRRWRCPPENERPFSVDHGVEAVGQALEDVLGGRGRSSGRRDAAAPRDVEAGRASRPANSAAPVSETMIAPRTSARRQRRERVRRPG